MHADLILKNADIWTGVAGAPHAQAIAIRDGKILAVGSDSEIGPYRVRVTSVLDLRGKFVMPGFIDNHTHFMEGGFSLLGINLRNAKDEEEFGRLIGERARQLPPGSWITGGNWDHESWPSHRLPTRRLIDALAPDTPVFVDRLDGHMALANSAALKLAGVSAATTDPPGGEIVRDSTGQPTGILRDAAMDFVSRIIPPPSEQERFRATEAALQEARRLGVTTVNAMCSRSDLAVFQSLLAAGKLTVRIYAITPLPEWESLKKVGIRRSAGSDFLKMGAVKGFMDGSLGSTTAWMFAPYLDEPTSTGLPAAMCFPDGNMKKLIQDADGADLQVAVHAIGDRANEELLNIYEQIEKAGGGKRDRRFRIEHAQHLSAQSIGRFAELGVIASMQPYHLVDDGRWAAKRIGLERLKTTYAFRSLLDSGAVLTFGSDWPVAPLDPILGVYAAVTRRTADDLNPRGWIPEQKISVEEALTCYTRNNAFAILAEDRLGALAPGKMADLVVLSDSPFRVDPVNIRNIRVLHTLVDGKTVLNGERRNAPVRIRPTGTKSSD